MVWRRQQIRRQPMADMAGNIQGGSGMMAGRPLPSSSLIPLLSVPNKAMGARKRYDLVLCLLFALTSFAGVFGASATDVSARNHKYDTATSRDVRVSKRLHFGLRNLPVKAPVPSYADFNQLQVRRITDAIYNCRAGQSAPSLLSKILFVFNQTLNIGTGALVGSGFLGSWIASVIIWKLQKLAMTLDSNTSDATLFKSKWSLTIASCGVYFVMKCQGIIARIFSGNTIDLLSAASDLGVLLSFWMYSSIVDPKVGGLVGCSYVTLELMSSLIGSRAIVNMLGKLRMFRLAPLDENGNMVNSLDKHTASNLPVREAISHAISSVPLIATIPQYFLTLYLISCTLLQFVPKNDVKWFRGITSWLQVGYPSKETVNIHPWDLSLQLFALHISIMATKGTIASVLL
jgi:hypothetical protein